MFFHILLIVMSSGAQRSWRKSSSERGIGQFIVYALLVVFVIGAGLRWRSQQELREVRINGLHTLSESEIRRVLDSTLLPKRVADVDLQAVRLAVLSVPFVRSAVVQRRAENCIEISVTERVPLALIVSDSGDPMYVDADAVVLPYRHLGESKDLPIVRGVFHTQAAAEAQSPGSSATPGTSLTLDTIAVANVVTLLREMQSTEGKTLYNDISEIVYDSRKRSFSLETSADASLVLFGTFDNHTEKVSNLFSLRRAWTGAVTGGAASVIDVRWRDKMFVTKRAL
ncbi:MAG: hypothetical protein RL156_806 [Bacteroidota bacterium]